MLFLIVKWIDAKTDKENTIHIKYTNSEELLKFKKAASPIKEKIVPIKTP